MSFIFVVLCVRLYGYCISFGTVFMFACTSDVCIKLLLTYLLTYLLKSKLSAKMSGGDDVGVKVRRSMDNKELPR